MVCLWCGQSRNYHNLLPHFLRYGEIYARVRFARAWRSANNLLIYYRFKVRKNGQKKKRATRLATLLQNKLNSDVVRFTIHIKPVLQQISLLTGLNVGGKTLNIAIQLILQKCCKTSYTFFVARFYAPLARAKSEALSQRK